MDKKCTKCKIVKTIDNFGRHRGRKDGINNQCKECVLIASRLKKPLKKRPDPTPDGTKRCSTCKVVKEFIEFGISKNGKDGLNCRCRECTRVSGQNSRRNDPNNKAKRCAYKLANIEQSIIGACRGADKRRGMMCDIDLDFVRQLIQRQDGINLYTNTPIKWGMKLNAKKNTGQHRCSSIDRIDSSIGHVKGNVQIMELWVNRLKLHYDMDTFNELLNQIKSPSEPTFETIVFDQLPRKQKLFLWNKINNTKTRQQKFTGDPKLEFDVYDLLDMWNDQGRRCAITKIPIVIHPNSPFSMSIDRIDPNKCYKLDNIHLTAWAINSAKSDMTMEEFEIALQDLKSGIS